jgi:hypothetical protein
MIDFEQFVYQFVLHPWADLEDRSKLANAIKLLCQRMPEDVFDDLPGIVVFAPAPWKYGQVTPPPSGTTDTMVYFAPGLEDEPQEQSDFTVAHEFAHAFLRHHSYESMTSPEETAPSEYLEVPSEVAADRLCQQWGYTMPEYRKKA